MTKQKVVPIGRKVLIKNKKAAQFYSGTQIIRTEAVEDFVADNNLLLKKRHNQIIK